MYSGEYDACDVTLSVYPHWASLKNMPDHGGNRTYDLWNNDIYLKSTLLLHADLISHFGVLYAPINIMPPGGGGGWTVRGDLPYSMLARGRGIYFPSVSCESGHSALQGNLETRARNPLWRLAEALGNTGDFCMKISTFGSSTPLNIYK